MTVPMHNLVRIPIVAASLRMINIFLLIYILHGIQVWAEPQQVQMAIPQNEQEAPVISYSWQNAPLTMVLHQDHRTRVFICIWKNGRVIWSKDQEGGEPPYFTGLIEKERVEDLLLRLKQKGYFEQPSLKRTYSGPEGRTSSMVIVSGTRVLSMESWHELAEQHPNIIALSTGLMTLNGRSREEVWAEEKDEDYILFRRVWDEIRSGILGLTPKEEGERIDSVQFEKRPIDVGGENNLVNKKVP